MIFITMSEKASENAPKILGVMFVGLMALTITFGVLYGQEKSKNEDAVDSAVTPATTESEVDPFADFVRRGPASTNYCEGTKPKHASAEADWYFNDTACLVDGVVQVLEQAGANVTMGYKGEFNVNGREPITTPYFEAGLCPVNVHWHLGAEHLSVGEYDEMGMGPEDNGSDEREGHTCHHFDAADDKFTKPYDWQYCHDMEVGQTYEIHWPHSAAGACGTVHQYQYPFYDGVFCNPGIISLDPLNTFEKIGVHGQVFTIVNDEEYFYPNLIRGMVVDAEREMGTHVTKYTGSTTGTSRDNDVCSKFTPITWQVDRKCHMISASSFDKMCADMLTQLDDMSGDTHPHGSRETTSDETTANNQQNLRKRYF